MMSWKNWAISAAATFSIVEQSYAEDSSSKKVLGDSPFNPDNWANHIDAHDREPEQMLDPAVRPEKCYGIALADSTDFGPY